MSPSPQDPVSREAEPSRSQLVTPDDFGPLYQRWLAGIRKTTDTLEDWALVGIKRRGAVLARRLLEDLGGSAGTGRLQHLWENSLGILKRIPNY